MLRRLVQTADWLMVPSISGRKDLASGTSGSCYTGPISAEMKGSAENPKDLMGFGACRFFLQGTIYSPANTLELFGRVLVQV